MQSVTAPKGLVWAGIILIAITGLIHLIDAPEYYAYAPYLGGLFVANAVGAAVAAVGIYRGARSWGWSLGALVAGGALIGYIVSRTMGLPGLPEDDRAWLDPSGVASMIVEALYLLVYFRALARPSSVAILDDRRA